MSQAPSFYAPVPESPREDLLNAYLAFLEKRNGSLDATVPFPKREAWLDESRGWSVRSRHAVDPTAFQRGWSGGTSDLGDLALQTLLSFVRINAGEAYGVEVVSRRHTDHTSMEPFDQVQRVLTNEETYHTRILLGATQQFGVPSPTEAWRPPLLLKILIGSLAYSPKAIFHPILLGSEIAGIFAFNWLLQAVGKLFPEEPELRESLERRLIEILIDEVGHVAFNRLAVGPSGLSIGRKLAPHVVNGNLPDMRGLGWNPNTLRELDHLDFGSLPEEVRQRAFFV